MAKKASQSGAPARGVVCHFGTFPLAPEYSRNQSVALALAQAGYRVERCHAPTQESAKSRVGAFKNPLRLLRSVLGMAGQWWSLWRQHGRLADYDIMVVGYPAHVDIFLGALLARWRRRPVVMDAFIGLYDTVVRDRGLAREGSLKARVIRAWERCAFRLAGRILMDTDAHAAALADDYQLPRECVLAVPVGIDERAWAATPPPPPAERIRVGLWSTFIPLHGVETVARAAALLEAKGVPIDLDVLGDGQTADAFKAEIEAAGLAHVHWERRFAPMEDVIALARRCHACIGILGTSEKAARVVPYKVYQALATGRPVVTADTPAARAVLEDGTSALLVPAGDAQALADALARLAGDAKLRQQLASGGRRAFEQHLSLAVLAERLATGITPLLPGPEGR